MTSSSISLLNFFLSLSFFLIGITDSFIILPHFFSTVNTFSTDFLDLAVLYIHISLFTLPYVHIYLNFTLIQRLQEINQLPCSLFVCRH